VPGEIPPLPPELSAREQELRALVDAGAGSPEELRELAAKLKEQRTYEESVWAREVKPALIQSRKKRPSIVDLRREGVESDRNSIVLGLVLLVALLVLIVIATQTSFLLLLVGAAGVLVYAWFHGLKRTDRPPSEPPPSDTTG
jgi:Flp pilus assembly protein TadB